MPDMDRLEKMRWDAQRPGVENDELQVKERVLK